MRKRKARGRKRRRRRRRRRRRTRRKKVDVVERKGRRKNMGISPIRGRQKGKWVKEGGREGRRERGRDIFVNKSIDQKLACFLPLPPSLPPSHQEPAKNRGDPCQENA